MRPRRRRCPRPTAGPPPKASAPPAPVYISSPSRESPPSPIRAIVTLTTAGPDSGGQVTSPRLAGLSRARTSMWQPAGIAPQPDPVGPFGLAGLAFLGPPSPDTGIIACPSPQDRRNDGFPRQAARPQEERGRRGHEDRAVSSLDAGGRTRTSICPARP